MSEHSVSETAQEIWFLAKVSPRGLLLRTNKTQALISALYEERKRLLDPELEEFSISPHALFDGNLVIWRKPPTTLPVSEEEELESAEIQANR